MSETATNTAKNTDQSYWQQVRRRYRKSRLAVLAMRFLAVLIFVAVFADFLANEKPIYCKIDGESYFPIFREYAVDLGLAGWPPALRDNQWNDTTRCSVKILALIPYSANTPDYANTYKGPFAEQKVKSRRYRHWLGTGNLGIDVAAGMIRGTRVALLVGIISMGIATLIGLFLGALAGFFGDNGFKISRIRLWLNLLGLPFAVFYAFVPRWYYLLEGAQLGWEWLRALGTFALIMALLNALAYVLRSWEPLSRKVTIPLDLLIMRLIETRNAIPGLILLLAFLAIIQKPSILNVMLIIGLISWTGIARFVRGELLRIRQLEYIEAMRALGLSNWRILVRHALPNALTPVLITISFGIAGAVLAEAGLSFLSIGLPPEEISWGKLLAGSRSNISAWWLATFPGFGIFITVTVFNLIGETLSEALNPRATE